MSFFLKKSDYTWGNAIGWGNFAKHYELAGKESCGWGHRVLYILEAPPIIGQIISIFEKFVAECCLKDEWPKPEYYNLVEIVKFEDTHSSIIDSLDYKKEEELPKNENSEPTQVILEIPIISQNSKEPKIEFFVASQEELEEKFKDIQSSDPNAVELSIVGTEGSEITLNEGMIEKICSMKNFKVLSLQNIHAGVLLATDPSTKKNPYDSYENLGKVVEAYNELPLSAPKETDIHVRECLIELPDERSNSQELREKMAVKKLTIQGKVLNVLFLGGSNSGKSTLFNVLSGDLSPQGRDNMFVGTKDPTFRSALFVRGKSQETFQLNALDSPGLNEMTKISSDFRGRSNENLLELIKENNLKFFGGDEKKAFEKIDRVIVTCRMSSGLNNQDLEAMTKSLKYIKDNGYTGKTIIVVTGSESLDPMIKKQRIEDFKLAVEKNHPEIAELEILFSGTPSRYDAEEKLQDSVNLQLKNCFTMQQRLVHNLFEKDIKQKFVFQSVRKDIFVDGGTVNKSGN